MPFIVDISDISDETDSEKSFQGGIRLKPIKMGNRRIDIEKEVNVTGVVRNVGDGVLVEGEVDVELGLECSRCLENYDTHLTVGLEEFYALRQDKVEADEDKELTPIIHNKIDLEPAIDQLIASEIPFKPLCRSDCAGICAVCGRNKNMYPHNCQEESIDIRMAKLKDYFKKSQEG